MSLTAVFAYSREEFLAFARERNLTEHRSLNGTMFWQNDELAPPGYFAPELYRMACVGDSGIPDPESGIVLPPVFMILTGAALTMDADYMRKLMKWP